MKLIIVGFPFSGKTEIANILTANGFKDCPKFSNAEGVGNYFTTEQVNGIFTNNIYLYLSQLYSYDTGFFSGALMDDWEKSDFITVTPREFMTIPQSLRGETLVIWLDNIRQERFQRWKETGSVYDFADYDAFERFGISRFADYLYKMENKHILYFSNDLPGRVAAIASACLKYPDLIPIFETHFN